MIVHQNTQVLFVEYTLFTPMTPDVEILVNVNPNKAINIPEYSVKLVQHFCSRLTENLFMSNSKLLA